MSDNSERPQPADVLLADYLPSVFSVNVARIVGWFE
jgi:hypothetical protein